MTGQKIVREAAADPGGNTCGTCGNRSVCDGMCWAENGPRYGEVMNPGEAACERYIPDGPVRKEDRKCRECRFWCASDEACGNGRAEECGSYIEEGRPACDLFQAALVQTTEETGIALRSDVRQLGEYVGQVGRYMAQMGQMMGALQRRLDEMEARQAAVTIRHADVIRLNRLIRYRAGQFCQKYALSGKAAVMAVRKAIHKDVEARYQVKDLHDLPAASLAGAESMIEGWTSIRLAMDLRGVKA